MGRCGSLSPVGGRGQAPARARRFLRPAAAGHRSKLNARSRGFGSPLRGRRGRATTARPPTPRVTMPPRPAGRTLSAAAARTPSGRSSPARSPVLRLRPPASLFVAAALRRPRAAARVGLPFVLPAGALRSPGGLRSPRRSPPRCAAAQKARAPPVAPAPSRPRLPGRAPRPRGKGGGCADACPLRASAQGAANSPGNVRACAAPRVVPAFRRGCVPAAFPVGGAPVRASF